MAVSLVTPGQIKQQLQTNFAAADSEATKIQKILDLIDSLALLTALPTSPKSYQELTDLSLCLKAKIDALTSLVERNRLSKKLKALFSIKFFTLTEDLIRAAADFLCSKDLIALDNTTSWLHNAVVDKSQRVKAFTLAQRYFPEEGIKVQVCRDRLSVVCYTDRQLSILLTHHCVMAHITAVGLVHASAAQTLKCLQAIQSPCKSHLRRILIADTLLSEEIVGALFSLMQKQNADGMALTLQGTTKTAPTQAALTTLQAQKPDKCIVMEVEQPISIDDVLEMDVYWRQLDALLTQINSEGCAAKDIQDAFGNLPAEIQEQILINIRRTLGSDAKNEQALALFNSNPKDIRVQAAIMTLAQKHSEKEIISPPTGTSS